MDTAVNAVFEILSFSSMMALIVIGLGIVASMMNIFNFAHGEFVLLGAYFTYIFTTTVCRSLLPWLSRHWLWR
ncbi:MAG TPA: hypothetical protein VMB34_04635 [Acetobacteraceae bacterium]|nr:hypothetical protein [Acetobacteraceae bacterium]